jgi:hypothetical protein
VKIDFQGKVEFRIPRTDTIPTSRLSGTGRKLMGNDIYAFYTIQYENMCRKCENSQKTLTSLVKGASKTGQLDFWARIFIFGCVNLYELVHFFRANLPNYF